MRFELTFHRLKVYFPNQLEDSSVKILTRFSPACSHYFLGYLQRLFFLCVIPPQYCRDRGTRTPSPHRQCSMLAITLRSRKFGGAEGNRTLLIEQRDRLSSTTEQTPAPNFQHVKELYLTKKTRLKLG
jgi:hypothetical protein